MVLFHPTSRNDWNSIVSSQGGSTLKRPDFLSRFKSTFNASANTPQTTPRREIRSPQACPTTPSFNDRKLEVGHFPPTLLKEKSGEPLFKEDWGETTDSRHSYTFANTDKSGHSRKCYKASSIDKHSIQNITRNDTHSTFSVASTSQISSYYSFLASVVRVIVCLQRRKLQKIIR